MRKSPEAETDSAARLTAPLRWRVTAVESRPNWRIAVSFADGTSGIVDLTRLIFGDNPGVFEELRDARAFGAVYVDDGVVTWPSGLDLAPDAMYDGIRQHGEWLPQ